MGLILRTSHEPMPLGSTISNTRLTIEQMDSNFIFLQNISSEAITITYTEALDLIDNNQVIRGRNYLITDCDPSLYGSDSPFLFGDGTEIILQGLDTNSFTSQGYGKFYNPKYSDPYDVWSNSNSYNLNDIVIYGGRVWRMATYTENWGSVDYFNLASDWVAISYENANYYNVVWDEVEYDLQDNYISSRYDVYNNNFVKNNYRTQYFYCNAYPIHSFRWGHSVDMGGLADCTVNNSFFGCLNYIGGLGNSIYNINLENQSAIYDLQLYGNSSFYNIKLSSSYIGSLAFENSDIYNLLLENDSFFGDIEITNTDISYVSMVDSYFGNMGFLNSQFYSIVLSNSSFGYGGFEDSEIYDIEINNNSDFNYFDLYNSTFRSIKVENSSFFGNNELSNASIEYINVSNDSNFQYNTVSNGSINNVSVDVDSYFGNTYINYNNNSNYSYIANVKITNNSYISNDDDNIYLDNGSYMNGVSLDNYSYITGYMELNNYSSIRYITINNRSYLDGGSGIYLNNNCYLGDIYINNNSSLRGYLSIQNNSNLEKINIDNDSDFGYGVYLDSSYISNIEVSNSSGFAGWWEDIDLYNSSYISDITVSGNSYVGNLSFNFSSSFYDVRVIENSTLGNISLSGSSYIGNVTINGDSYLGDYIELNNSYIEYGVINTNSSINSIIFISSFITNFNLSCGSSIQATSTNNTLQSSHINTILLSSKSIFGNFYLHSSIIQYLNLDHSDFIGLSMSNSSEIIKYKSNNSTLGNVNISNASGLYGVNLNNTYYYGNQTDGIGSFFIDGESVVANVILTNVSITNQEVNTGFNLQSGSFFNDSIISNSQIYNIYGYNSNLRKLTLNNESTIHNISLTSSNITHSDLSISSLDNLNLHNNSLFGLFLKQSNFRNYTTDNNIINLNMNGTYLDLTTISGGLLFNNTDMAYNTIKYQFSRNLTGMYVGQYNLNVLIPGPGWYIEKVIIDNTKSPIVSTGNSVLTLGLLNLNQSYVFSSVDTAIFSGIIKVYDISNGSLSGAVSTDIDYLNLNMGGDDIYSGVLDFEVILKNTSFFYSND